MDAFDNTGNHKQERAQYDITMEDAPYVPVWPATQDSQAAPSIPQQHLLSTSEYQFIYPDPIACQINHQYGSHDVADPTKSRSELQSGPRNVIAPTAVPIAVQIAVPIVPQIAVPIAAPQGLSQQTSTQHALPHAAKKTYKPNKSSLKHKKFDGRFVCRFCERDFSLREDVRTHQGTGTKRGRRLCEDMEEGDVYDVKECVERRWKRDEQGKPLAPEDPNLYEDIRKKLFADREKRKGQQ